MLTIGIFFCILSILCVLEQALWSVKRHNNRRTAFCLLGTLPVLWVLCGSCMLWSFIPSGHLVLAIGLWWLTGFALVLVRYVTRRWAFKEAVLQTEKYKLFGRRVGRFSKRTKHEKASLYQLADKSAFPRHSVMTLISDEPKIYASPEARAMLDPDQFRTIVAHELGHSWSTHHVGYEVADWIRRLLFIPLLASAVTVLLGKMPTTAAQFSAPLFLATLALIWHLNNWMSTILGRPRELAADLYGVEVTRTPTAFVEAMAKLAEVEPYNVFPNLFDTLALCSHPCTVKRLKHVVAALSNPSRQGDRERVRGSRSD